MKTTKILGATTLAGALLFTGVGATHSNEAHADTQKVTLPTPDQWQKQHDRLLESRLAGHGGEGGGPGAVNSYDNSYNEYVQHNLDYEKKYGMVHFVIPSEGKAYLNGQDTQGNDQSSQATDNTVAAQNNGQQAQATDNTVTQANTQAQSEAQALPETGETSNTTLVTMIAAVMLAAGSLLTFKRFSKDNK